MFFQLVQGKGLEADRHLLRCLLSSVDFSTEEPPEPSAKDYYQVEFLRQEITALLNKPSLISNICFAFDCPLLQQKVLKLICIYCNNIYNLYLKI